MTSKNPVHPAWRYGWLALVAAILYSVSRTVMAVVPVGIAVLAYRGEAAAQLSWEATADYLTGTIPGHRFFIVPLMNSTLGPAVAARQVQFVVTNPGSYIELESKYGVTRMLTLRNLRQGGAYTRFGAVIFVRADRADLRELADLRGRSFMGVRKDAFGGFLLARRELSEVGIDPFKDFARLEFSGLPQDNIVYAVRDGRVDAGTVRTDTLERMAAEGLISPDAFKIIGAQRHPGFPFLASTRLYPEWAFARLPDVPEDLAQQVAIALLRLPSDSRAARDSESAGWTVPLDYTPVHELYRELRIGPYADFGAVGVLDAARQHWPWLVAMTFGMVVLAANFLYILVLNRRLRETTRSLADLNAELERLSTQDGLTGVANHRTFKEKLAREWARGLRERKPLSLVMADIDHFKLLNDSDGHPAGDECLRQVAQALARSLQRPTDLLARYGGEEFAAVLPATEESGAAAVAGRMHAAVAALGLPNRGTGRPVSISLGVATVRPERQDAAEGLVREADRALYRAKETGRNRIATAN